MKIKIIGTQIYEDHVENLEQEFDDAKIYIEKDMCFIEYASGKIIFNMDKNTVEIKNQNDIVVELNKTLEMDYATPYGIIKLKTFGKEINLQEKNFRLSIKYSIKLNETIEYENVLEVVAI